ncbi:pentapeptide repeat-containing protein [Nostoc sp. ChiSLP03a]|uniref:pentapeptide repeat-containing protein n=1 Tax=Nostoc sp. ChiSLP03a TaxID=3075380 RepID=UPI002AD52D5E|nr:pentapeptide repeat-containing protein [Nostoc sp. ChiSLP03a]MDZ8216006.1 pentapeptide repeat-containing protein [Nostoc sp. ChiSLP03a]
MPPDYSGKNLRGRSFIGQNLTGVNFSKADIRGANFTNAILKDAVFTDAKAGLQIHWVIRLLIILLLLSVLSGFASEYVIYGLYCLIDPNQTYTRTASIATLVVLVFFFSLTIYKGLDISLNISIFVSAIASSVVTATISTIVHLHGKNMSNGVSFAGAVAAAIVDAGVIDGAIIIFGMNQVNIYNFVRIAFIVGFAAFCSSNVVSETRDKIDILSFRTVTGIVIAFIMSLSIYIAWNAMKGDERYDLIRKIAIAFAATGGTSFRNADLTNANLTGATLKNTDFREANLTGTCFYKAKKLDLARLDKTILTNPDVLNLLVTCDGRGKSYSGANLKGANLKNANLKEANLKGADIGQAMLQGACLEWANLTLAQAVSTNFTNAKMTGACIEAWNIESTTKLDNVDCRFIYLLENPKPETDDYERRPSNGNFQTGEFTKLFEEVLNTVDLIFRNGIDWKAFVNAFQTVQNQNADTELALQSIENKGDGVVVVKVGVPDGADKEKIHSDFTQSYQLALQAVEEKYKAVLQAKDEQIVIYRQQSGEMAEIVKLLANKPINVQVDNKVENKNMTNSNDASRKIEIGSVGRDFNASGQALNLGDISGTVTNTINELAASPEPDKPGIKELLTQLQAAIEADTNLAQEDKVEALEQVKALAEAGKNPQEGAMQKAAKTAIKILKGTISSLPSATKLVEQCSNLLPLISNFLGLG